MTINILIEHKEVVVICEGSGLEDYNFFFTNYINKKGVRTNVADWK
jgi:hypothetical protein